MVYLILSILSSTLIFLTFKISERYNLSLVKLIVVNYITASALGFSFYPGEFSVHSIYTSSWIPFAILIGVLFVLFFFMIGKSTQLSGVGVTTIASKMSMAIPILYSLIFFSEELNIVKLTGLVAAFFSVFLCIYKPGQNSIFNLKLILPIIIFFGTGFADSLIKYTQHFLVKNDITLLFSSTVFSVALVFGLLYSLVFERKFNEYIRIHLLVGGMVLGAANFGSLYFLMQSLEKTSIESSIIFGVNNLSIVGLSVIIGFFVFSEKLNRINLIGIILAILSIIILTRF